MMSGPGLVMFFRGLLGNITFGVLISDIDDVFVGCD